MIGLACLVAALLLFVEHWFPWGLVIGRVLPRPAAYVLGVLAMIVPLSVLLVFWGEWLVLGALWAVIVSGGAAVLGAYALDWLLDLRMRVREQEELLEVRSNGSDGKA
jgi:hypothetical protein